MKSISLRDAVRIIRPEYVYLRLKPSNSIRNNNTHKLARTIASLYKNILENVKKEEIRTMTILGRQLFIPTRLTYEMPAKVAYFIYIEKKAVEFYFILPRSQLSVMKEKIGDVWTGITAEQVDALPAFPYPTMYQLTYAKEDALSLSTDRRNNDLLNSTLNVIDVMEEGDRAGVLYNFIPTSQFSWRANYRSTIDKIRNNMPVDRNKMGSTYLLKMGVSLLVSFADTLFGAISTSTKAAGRSHPLEALLERLNGGKKVSESTSKKATASILNSQIIVMSESDEPIRERNNARSLAQSFDTVTEDNSLRFRMYRGKFHYTDCVIRGAAINKMGDEECSNFIALPGREVLERYNMIEKVETQETEVPEDLQKGVLRIGVNRYRGKDQPAYLSNDKEYKNLTLVLIGPTRAGKTTLIGNLAYDAITAGECVVIFDYIGSCQLSSEVSALFPKEKTLTIDCGDPKTLQGLGYNEVGVSLDPFRQYDNAKRQTTQVKTLINSVNAGDSPLTARMERYLESASNLVFVSGGSIRDVFAVLQDHKERRRFIAESPKNQSENLAEYLSNLNELDECDKKGNIIGTKDILISGIIDRLNKLKANTYMEAMLKKSTAANINLAKEMQRNQIICLRMPEIMFSTDGERDIYTTYWMTKIWMALQIREQQAGGDRSKLTKVNLVIDELYQVENTQRFLSDKLSRLAKFGMKPIISAHYINQIAHIRQELRSANASYMLISGCDKKNFDELKDELYPFMLDDLLKLPRFHSLNLIKNTEGYARFITKLPKPI